MTKARVVFAVAMFATQCLWAGISAVNLQCGFWQNPLGIDDPQPRLSWQLQATAPGQRAQSQTAFQILVASSTNLLAADQGDLWNSGKVVSDSPLNTAYAGSPMTSAQQVFWKVRVWDQNDLASAWSPGATWTMGLAFSSGSSIRE